MEGAYEERHDPWTDVAWEGAYGTLTQDELDRLFSVISRRSDVLDRTMPDPRRLLFARYLAEHRIINEWFEERLP